MHVLRRPVTDAAGAADHATWVHSDKGGAALTTHSALPTFASVVADHSYQVRPRCPVASAGPWTTIVDQSGVALSASAMSRSYPRRPAAARSRSLYGNTVAASWVTYAG